MKYSSTSLLHFKVESALSFTVLVPGFFVVGLRGTIPVHSFMVSYYAMAALILMVLSRVDNLFAFSRQQHSAPAGRRFA